MDKNTLSNYGWIVIAVLVLSVMIALATPFGSYIEQGVRATTEGLFDTSKNAVNSAFEDLGVQMEDQEFEEGYTGVNGTLVTELPAKGKTLEEYTWIEAKDIITAGKAIEYGFAVGSTKTLQINGDKKIATIIGLNHDGSNTATFMILSSGGIGYYPMNTSLTNVGGWKDSDMREWLNEDIYDTMSNKDCIKEVTKMTNNTGYQGTTVTSTSDKIFLLSPKEAGVTDKTTWESYPEEYELVLEAEGTIYEWFKFNTVDWSDTIDDTFWFRSPESCFCDFFFYNRGYLDYHVSDGDDIVCPAFVIG